MHKERNHAQNIESIIILGILGYITLELSAINILWDTVKNNL